MAQLVQYRRSDGQLQGLMESNTDALLEAQIVPDDATYGYLKLATPITAMVLEQYEVINGSLTAKAPLTITADNPIFPAQGGGKCTVSVDPFVPCTLLANIVDAYPLTTE